MGAEDGDGIDAAVGTADSAGDDDGGSVCGVGVVVGVVVVGDAVVGAAVGATVGGAVGADEGGMPVGVLLVQGGSETLHALAASRLTVGHRGVLASRRRLPQGQTYIYLVLRG